MAAKKRKSPARRRNVARPSAPPHAFYCDPARGKVEVTGTKQFVTHVLEAIIDERVTVGD